MLKTIFLGAALALAAGAAAIPSVASADTKWVINGATFDDGTTLTGAFSINVYGFLETAILTTDTNGVFTSETYDMSAPGTGSATGTSPPYFIDFNLDGGQEDLHVVFADPLITGESRNSIVLSGASYECQGSYGCGNDTAGNFRYLASGFATEVPEPATWAMMVLGVGLIGAGIRLTRDKRGLPAA